MANSLKARIEPFWSPEQGLQAQEPPTGSNNGRRRKGNQEAAGKGPPAAGGGTGELYAQDTKGLLLIFQRWTPRARTRDKHVMSASTAGLPGLLLQCPSPEELDHTSCGARRSRCRSAAHRHLQPLLLRRGARRPRDPSTSRSRSCAGVRSRTLEGAVRGHQRVRTVLTRNGYTIREVLSMSPRRSRSGGFSRPRDGEEELEVLAGRRQGRGLLGAVTWSVREHDPAHATLGAVVRVPPTTSRWRDFIVAAAVVDAAEDMKLEFRSVRGSEEGTRGRRKALESEKAEIAQTKRMLTSPRSRSGSTGSSRTLRHRGRTFAFHASRRPIRLTLIDTDQILRCGGRAVPAPTPPPPGFHEDAMSQKRAEIR